MVVEMLAETLAEAVAVVAVAETLAKLQDAQLVKLLLLLFLAADAIAVLSLTLQATRFPTAHHQ